MNLPLSILSVSTVLLATSVSFLLSLLPISVSAYDESFPVDMAETAEEIESDGKPVNGGVNMSLVSRYVWRGQYCTKGPGWEPEVWASAYGFVGSVWGAVPLSNDPYQGEFSEVDLSLMWAKKIKGLTIAPGYAHYCYPASGDPSTGELFMMMDYELKPFHIFTSQFFDVKENKGAYFGTLGFAFVYDFLERYSLKTALSTSWASPRFNEAYFSVDKWTISQVSFEIGVGISILEWLSIRPSFNYDVLADKALRDSTGEPNLFTFSIFIGAYF